MNNTNNNIMNNTNNNIMNNTNNNIINSSIITIADTNLLQSTIVMFKKGELYNCNKLLNYLCVKYRNNTDEKHPFIAQIYISYLVVNAILGIENKFIDIFMKIIKNINDYFTTTQDIENAYRTYVLYILEKKNYKDAVNYVKYLQPVNGMSAHVAVNPENSSYFNKDDHNKIMLIYMSGGIGDKIMFTRFIRKVCETQAVNNNSVIYLIDNNLFWMLEPALKDIDNLICMKYDDRNNICHFDHHRNINQLGYDLGLMYEDIYAEYYLKDAATSLIDLTYIIAPRKYNIVINWHGAYSNACEQHNRGMSLETLIPLFKLQHINWISVQKEFNAAEKKLMDKYKVKNLGATIDNDGDAFKDTLTILKKVDLFISTDTSLVNLAGTADINTWVLLTSGCEWRWTKDEKTNWYPKLKLFRQKKALDWSNVITEVLSELNTNFKSKEK